MLGKRYSKRRFITMGAVFGLVALKVMAVELGWNTTLLDIALIAAIAAIAIHAWKNFIALGRVIWFFLTGR